MEALAFFRLLRRLWLAVAVGFVLATVLGIAMMKRGSHEVIGIASARVILDTPESQVVDSQVVGADSLPWRASVLSDLMRDAEQRRGIARAVGASARELAIVTPHLNLPEADTPLSTRALPAGSAVYERLVVAVQALPALPIVEINTSAPTAAQAARLAKATAAQIKAAATPPASVVDPQPYVVEDLGSVRSTTVVSGSRRIVGPIFALVFFCGWCLALLVLTGLQRAWRRIMQPSPAAMSGA